MNTDTPKTTPATSTDKPAINLIAADLEKLTPEQFESVRRRIAALIASQKEAATKKVQMHLTPAEYAAIAEIATREKLHVATFLRYYFRCVHPELGTLTARIKNATVNQHRLIARILDDERLDQTALRPALAELERLTTELMRLINERR